MAESFELERALDVARRAVDAASEACLRWFERDAGVKWKQDGTPVTNADRDAEDAIVRIIRDVFPDHAILAEESGAMEGDAETRWIIDPLDGTHRFARGMPFWGPLIALEHKGEVVVGAMALPTQEQSFWAARGMGCWRDGVRVNVSDETDWRRSNLSLGAIGRILETPARDGVLKLIETSTYTISGGDLAGAALVLTGQAEAWIESGVKIWDIAPFKVMVEEAGGMFTDFEGGGRIDTGRAVASNGTLHRHVLEAIMSGGIAR
ncbi:MAG: inositol monophosphatase [Phycisphaeraceae bacterium]|nr:MAG: inositol monophosphatase [Phycisphaeraceae bacterium]